MKKLVLSLCLISGNIFSCENCVQVMECYIMNTYENGRTEFDKGFMKGLEIAIEITEFYHNEKGLSH